MTQEAKILIGIGVAAVILFIGAAFMFGDSSKKTEEEVSIPDAKRLVREDSVHSASASASAKITIVEFGDYQCPACGVVEPTLKEVLAFYQGDVDLVFRNFPLPLHQNAEVAAEAAEAAGTQGKYWEMHDILYAKQKEWDVSNTPLDIFAEYAKTLDINVDAFKVFVQQKSAEQKITRDKDDGVTLGVNSTPTFYINGEKLVSQTLPTLDVFKSKINPLLKK